jgi:sec-independent protein translocase protein TatB
MFDFGWQELILIALVAIIVVSPKDLPQAIRAVTQFARQLRGLSREFRSGVNELVREAELEELKRQVGAAGNIDHLNRLTSEGDPTSGLTEDFDPQQFARELKRRVNPEASSSADVAKSRDQTDVNPAVARAVDRADAGENAGGETGPASLTAEKKISV